jgi:curved DNA-binding protein CbpA
MSGDKHSAVTFGPKVVPEALGTYEAQPGVELSPQDWFVLSRIDGTSNAHLIGQMCGLSDDAVLAALTRLHRAALARVPGLEELVATVDVHAAHTRPLPVVSVSEEKEHLNSRRSSGLQPVLTPSLCDRGWPTPLGAFPFESDILAEGKELSLEQKKVVLYFHYHLRRVTYYQLFAIPQNADERAIRTAYFALSKQFHPDRWFRKDIGMFRERIEEIFKWLNRANGVLMHRNKRRGYDNLLSRGYTGEWQLEDMERGGRVAAKPASFSSPRVETVPPVKVPVSEPLDRDGTARAEAGRRSAQMFRARARHAETNGDWDTAVDQLERAIELSPTTELRIALIECMLRGHSKIAEIERALADSLSSAGSDLRLVLLDAEVSFRKGDVERAQALYEHVLVSAPASPVARMGLERIRGTS